ncbi:DUF4168 domain-containing protein [[Limnothrix rosea] IAM M-220]|uniref:DUF4168 domain-containing protein n=1 Tax=[Limnothrix rosea] IAM M-220 TaxID=454133 RepID=UPI000965F9F1|nr:DUF4168 domain-containing protein [[Limnothrix rosea] IAM M-220]OKH11731.1 hypothetical protein NIES208_16910 [[Limnothrix rosea] IAM M-220]
MSLPLRLRYFALSSLMTIGSIALGVAPQLEATSTPLSWQQQAIAQTFSPSDLRKYAEAYLAIYGGNRMESLLLEVEELTGKKTDWEVRCDDSGSIRKLGNREAIRKVRAYCNEELPALIDNIIPRSTFNQISNRLENDPALQSTIFDLMTEILNER